MKKNILSTLIAATSLSLIGCNADDVSNNAELTSRAVTANLSTPTSVDISSDEYCGDANIHEICHLQGKVVKIYSKGSFNDELFAHFLRVDGYSIFVEDKIDGIGENKTYTVAELIASNGGTEDDITKLKSFTIDVIGDAKITLVAPQQYSQKGIAYSYTAIGEEYIDRSINDFELEAVNDPRYSFVTVTATEDVDARNTLLADETMFGTFNKDKTKAYHSAYVIQEDSVLTITTTTGESMYQNLSDYVDPETGLADGYDPKIAKHWNFIVSKSENGGIIITPPDFADPIEISPKEPVLSSESLHFANIVSTDFNGSVIINVDKSERDDREDEAKAVTNVAPGYALGSYNQEFSGIIHGEGETSHLFVNIYLDGLYLINGSLREVKAISLTNETKDTGIVTVSYEDYSETNSAPLSDFQEHKVILWNELGGLTLGNFYLRLNAEVTNAEGELEPNRNVGRNIEINEYNFDLKDGAEPILP
ncbi:hypothetical protein [Vibrio maritimus]|uniref:hypothetical protein n=1 Tax=Vibrio maritimus TaxID=990268 RepID=UPI001F45BD6F|nr:hypothetical protein [Vibrio maritimus]